MIQAKIINRINFPKFTFQKDLEFIAKDIIIPLIIKGIDDGASIDGGRLPENEPKTIKRKGDNRQLIETGKLRSSFSYRTSGKNKVIISIKGDRKEIGGYLQIDGIKTKTSLKFYRFFGISQDAYRAAIEYIKDRIKESINARR